MNLNETASDPAARAVEEAARALSRAAAVTKSAIRTQGSMAVAAAMGIASTIGGTVAPMEQAKTLFE